MLQKMTAGCKPHKTNNSKPKMRRCCISYEKVYFKGSDPQTNEANDQRSARVQAIANLIFPYKGKAANNH